MSEYQGCDKCKYGNNQPTEYPCLECEHNRAMDHYEPMTNADKIRNMTDEELAEFLIKEFDNKMICDKCYEFIEDRPCKHNCDKQLLKWLQAEVKED